MALSSSNVRASKNDKWIIPDPKSPLWKYVTILEKIQGGGGCKWTCHECLTDYRGFYTRVLSRAPLSHNKERVRYMFWTKC